MKTKQGFTLVELLVTIAIIGILAAILLPVFSRARNQAGKATDLNNLKQIMVATHVYAQDNGDILPSPNWDAGGPLADGVYHPGWLYTADPAVSGPAHYKLEAGLFWPTLHNPKVYLCPIDDPTASHMSQHDGQVATRSQQLSSYAMNGAVIGYMFGWTHPQVPPVKLAAMSPMAAAFWETDESDPYYFNDGANYPPEGVSPRHQQGGIQATFSGAVNYIRFEQWHAEMGDPARNRLWCYPFSPDGRQPVNWNSP